MIKPLCINITMCPTPKPSPVGSIAARGCKKTTECCFPPSVTEPQRERGTTAVVDEVSYSNFKSAKSIPKLLRISSATISKLFLIDSFVYLSTFMPQNESSLSLFKSASSCSVAECCIPSISITVFFYAI